MGKKIISFSLWGKDEDYNLGALENIVESQEFYPGWICRYYVEISSPVLDKLKSSPCEVVLRPPERSFRPGFWRFLAASDPEADFVIFRDCDCRLNQREASAVQEWIKSGKNAHVMKDLDSHSPPPILAGMWGVRRGVIPNMGRLIWDWYEEGGPCNKGGDQKFLAERIWPIIEKDVLIHHRNPGSGPALPFPKHGRLRPGQNYVGQYVRPGQSYIGKPSQYHDVFLPRPGAGLLFNFRLVVGNIAKFEVPNSTLVAYFGRDFLYWSPEGHRGRKNGWEYYFKPIMPSVGLPELLGKREEEICALSGGDLRKLLKASEGQNVRFSDKFHPDILGSYVGRGFDAQRVIGCRIVRSHIRLQDDVLDRYEKIRSSLFSGREAIGVHYRGTDKKTDVSGMGFPSLEIEPYFEKVDACLGQRPDAPIFVATDSESVLEYFRARYGSRVIFIEAVRSKSGAPVHKKGATPEMGEEALMDTLLLSACHTLVCGISNLPVAASYFNPKLIVRNVYEGIPPS